jgi:hypothetical protein
MACECFICRFRQQDKCRRCSHTRRYHSWYVGHCLQGSEDDPKRESGGPAKQCLCEGFVEPDENIYVLWQEWDKAQALNVGG